MKKDNSILLQENNFLNHIELYKEDYSEQDLETDLIKMKLKK